MLAIKEELSRIETGVSSQFRNLTVFPLLFGSAPAGKLDYMLLEDGIAQGKVRITEIHAGGSVPELRVENTADIPVLLVDGEELVGAKQNRVLNLTILVPAKQKTVIPVSCVEAGRWSVTNPDLRPANHFMYAQARGARVSQVTHSMRASGSRRSDQAAIWEEIADKSARLGVASPTRSMSDIFCGHAHVVEDFLRAFAWVDGQRGAAFAIGGQFVGLDLFDHPETMRRFFGKLVRSYALDALDGAVITTGLPSVDSLTAFLAGIANAHAFCEDAVGIGKDVRFNTPEVCGAALWAQERYVHICAFVKPARQDGGSFWTRLSRPSQRRVF
jgi:hypothetical protein